MNKLKLFKSFIYFIYLSFLLLVGPAFFLMVLFGIWEDDNVYRLFGKNLDIYFHYYSFFSSNSVWLVIPMETLLPKMMPFFAIGLCQLLVIAGVLEWKFFNTTEVQNRYQHSSSINVAIKISLVLGTMFFLTFWLGYYCFQFNLVRAFLIDNSISVFSKHPLFLICYGVVGCLLAAISEELLFRHLLWAIFKEKLHWVLNAVLNTVLFAGLHYLVGIDHYFVIICSLFSCYIVHQSKSYYGCVLFHFLGNIFLLTLNLID